MNKKTILTTTISIIVIVAIAFFVYSMVTLKDDVPVTGKSTAYLIDRDTGEVARTTDVTIDGYISGANEKDFNGEIKIYDLFLSGLPDFQRTENGNYYSIDGRSFNDSETFGYSSAFVLTDDMDFSTYVVGFAEEYTRNSYNYCFVCNVADENEAIEVYNKMKVDIDDCYSQLGTDQDHYTYQGTGIIRDGEGKEIGKTPVTVDGLYYYYEKEHYFYGELIVDGYYESGINDVRHMVTEYTEEVVYHLQNEDGISAEIHGNPFEGEDIRIIITTYKDDDQVTLYEIECDKK